MKEPLPKPSSSVKVHRVLSLHLSTLLNPLDYYTTLILLGVEKFITDMNKNRVVVTGRIDPMKVMKKLKKKTGKRVEIVSKKEEEAEDESHESDELVVMHQFALENDCCMESEAMMIFSDENPNACALM